MAQSLKDLRISVLKRELERVGYNIEAFTKKEIEAMADEAFKGFDGKQLKSFGAIPKIENGELVLQKVKGQIRKRQREQIESFRLAGFGEEPRTFGQQIAAQNIKAAYGYDVFDFIKQNSITDYDISAMEYEDPITGDRKSFVGRI
jgi:hypothetical protein